MTRRPEPAEPEPSQAEKRRRHLLTILRAAPLPMSTTDLVATCPDDVYTWQTPCPCRRTDQLAPKVLRCEHGWYEAAEPARYTNVYANLRQLERAGLVSRLPSGPGTVVWQAVVTAEEAARMAEVLDALEAEFCTPDS